MTVTRVLKDRIVLYSNQVAYVTKGTLDATNPTAKLYLESQPKNYSLTTTIKGQLREKATR